MSAFITHAIEGMLWKKKQRLNQDLVALFPMDVGLPPGILVKTVLELYLRRPRKYSAPGTQISGHRVGGRQLQF